MSTNRRMSWGSMAGSLCCGGAPPIAVDPGVRGPRGGPYNTRGGGAPASCEVDGDGRVIFPRIGPRRKPGPTAGGGRGQGAPGAGGDPPWARRGPRGSVGRDVRREAAAGARPRGPPARSQGRGGGHARRGRLARGGHPALKGGGARRGPGAPREVPRRPDRLRREDDG